MRSRAGSISNGWSRILGPSEKKLLGQFATHGVQRVREAIARSAKLPETYFTDICPSGGFGRDGYVKLATEALEKKVLRPFAARGIPVSMRATPS